jgi:hypothetical protein
LAKCPCDCLMALIMEAVFPYSDFPRQHLRLVYLADFV